MISLCALFNRLLRQFLIKISQQCGTCQIKWTSAYCQTVWFNSQENADRNSELCKVYEIQFFILYLRFYFVFLFSFCALFNCKYIKSKCIGINVSAVIIYIHSLTNTVFIHDHLYKTFGWVSVFNGNTSVYICIPVPLFSITRHHLQTKTVERS